MVLVRLVALLLVGILAGCAVLGTRPEPPRVSLVAIEPLAMTLFEQRYRLSLRFQNPNDTPLEVEGMSYVVYLEDRRFATGVRAEPFTVPAFGEEVVRADVSSSVLRLFEQVRDWSAGPGSTLGWRLEGHLRLAGPGERLPFQHAGRLDLSPLSPPPQAETY